jgi:hypothetical protein
MLLPTGAEMLQIVRSRAHELVPDGTIPAVKLEHSVRVSCKELGQLSYQESSVDRPCFPKPLTRKILLRI